jgi:uncharacterized membrane protein YdjX (TVP38/TMEM64 family)
MKKRARIVNFFKKNWLILLIIILVSVLFIYSYYSKGLIYSISNSDSDSVVQFMESFGIFSYVIFVVIVILEVVLAPIPALALYIAGGALFGAFLGGILTLIGNLIGAFIAFWLARRFGRKFVEKRVDENVRKKFDKFSQKYGVFSLFLLRVNPLTTSDLFSYLAGLTSMKKRQFLIGTGLGLTPMIFLHTYFGETFVNNHPILYSVLLWISVAYLLIFVYLIWKSIQKSKSNTQNVNNSKKKSKKVSP